MQLTQLRTLESARRVQAFIDDHASVLDSAVTYILRAQLDAAVDELAAHQLEQELAKAIARCEAANYAALRRDIYERLIRPIRRIAIAALRSAREFAQLVMPVASLNAGHFRPHASMLAAAAEPHVAVFVAHGMHDDFIDQFHAALAQLAQSADARERHRHRHAEATDGLREASGSVRHLLALVECMVVPKINRDGMLLMTWRSARRAPSI